MPRRKRSTWGCVQRVRAGVYRIRWLEDTPEGRKRRSETFHGSRKEADRRLAEIRLATREDPTPTVEYVWTRYCLPKLDSDVRRKKTKAQTRRDYVASWESVVGPRWGSVPIGSILPHDVQDWLYSISNGAGNIGMVVLRRVTKQAKFLALVEHDPLSGLKFELTEPHKRSTTVPTLEELGELWGMCWGTWVEPAFLLCAHAGMRPGEVFALTPGDFQWTEGGAVIAIVNQITQMQTLDTVKTRAGNRVAVLPEPWARRMRQIIDGLRPDAVWLMDDGASEPSKLPSRQRLQYQWRKMVKGTRWQGMAMQRLRPAWETYMHWEWGIPIEKLKKLMGHESATFTSKRYDRPSEDQLIRLAFDAAKQHVFRNT